MDNSKTQLVDEREAARILCCSVALMRKHRHLGIGIPAIKHAALVRYSLGDITAYIDAQRQQQKRG